VTFWFLPFLLGVLAAKALSSGGESSTYVWRPTSAEGKWRAKAEAEEDDRIFADMIADLEQMAVWDAEDEMARSEYEAELEARAQERAQWNDIRRIIREGIME